METQQEVLPEFFAIKPKYDCPHIKDAMDIEKVNNFFENAIDIEMLHEKCEDCEEKSENWLCVSCFDLFCSRYKNQHMKLHYESIGHCIGFSLSDASFWCFTCDSYIDSEFLNKLRLLFSDMKFGKGNDLNDLVSKLENLDLKSNPLEELARLIKDEGKCRIGLFTGAGISVASGIPDFRSKGGLFEQLMEKHDMKADEMLNVNTYKDKLPEPFNEMCLKLAGDTKIQPSTAHYFHKLLEEKGLLVQAFTQNVDSLELKAGLSPDLLAQAHGHFRTASCISCKKVHETEDFLKCLKEGNQYFHCKCGGIVKPDVVLYGEQLPKNFFEKFCLLPKLDLAIVMGTSLIVAPFSLLPEQIKEDVPIFVLNLEKIRIARKNVFHIGGDLVENLEILIEKVGWKEDFNTIVSTHQKENEDSKL